MPILLNGIGTPINFAKVGAMSIYLTVLKYLD